MNYERLPKTNPIKADLRIGRVTTTFYSISSYAMNYEL